MMTIQEFTLKYSFKQRDREIAHKIYAGQSMMEEEWVKKLKGEFDFDASSFFKARNRAIIEEKRNARVQKPKLDPKDSEEGYEEDEHEEEDRPPQKKKSSKK